MIIKNFFRLSASTPISLAITYAFRFLQQRPKIVINYYQKDLGTKFKKCTFFFRFFFARTIEKVLAKYFFYCSRGEETEKERHFSFLHPIQFHTVEHIATKSIPHIKWLTDWEAIPFPTSSHFQFTAKFNSSASQNDVKSCSKVMYLHQGGVVSSYTDVFQLNTHLNLRQWPVSWVLKLTHFLLPLIKTTFFSFL